MTEKSKDEFQSKGFTIVRNLFSNEEVVEAREWLLSQDPTVLRKSWTETEPGVPLAVYSVIHELTNPLGRIASDQRIAKVASHLMGLQTYIWASKVNLKAAWCGAAEYYHQDFIYWKDRGYPSDQMLSCMVFMDSHSLSNAALHVLPGTHRHGTLLHEPFFNVNGLSKWMIPPQHLREIHATSGIEVVEGEPGDAVFFHASLVHGSGHNISPLNRMICLVQMNTVGNEPVNVEELSVSFNVRRATAECEEAERRLGFFREKLLRQRSATEVTFGAPIPREERNQH